MRKKIKTLDGRIITVRGILTGPIFNDFKLACSKYPLPGWVIDVSIGLNENKEADLVCENNYSYRWVFFHVCPSYHKLNKVTKMESWKHEFTHMYLAPIDYFIFKVKNNDLYTHFLEQTICDLVRDLKEK